MPRDGSGNYTLPAGNPVVNNTLIQSTWANPTMSDIAVQLNNVLTRDGVLGPTLPFKLVDGSVAAPGLAFNSEPSLGFYRPTASVINLAAGNAITATLDASSSATTRLSAFPRSAAGSAVLLLSNQPSGTANRTDTIFTMDATGLTIASVPSGTGTVLPVNFTGPVNLTPPGMFATFMLTAAPSGWIAGDGGTIGNASSGATTRANADTQALFTVWWTQFNDAQLPIQTSAGGASTRGASAAADWAANKRLTVFDVRNRFARAADASNTIVGTAYADTLASHTHGVNDPSHNHSVNDPSHTHVIANDVTNDFGGGSALSGTGNVGIGSKSTNAAVTGISLNAALTGISIQSTGSAETRPKSIGMLGCFKL